MSDFNVSVDIVVQGLIALIPFFGGGPGTVDHMTALVVDSEQYPIGDICRELHEPKIQFRTPDRICVQDPRGDCDTKNGFCVCPLGRHEITILPSDLPQTPETEPRMPHSSGPPTPLPENRQADVAGNFKYVANFRHLGYSLDPIHLSQVPPSIIAARFRFPFENLLACDHSFYEDELGAATVYPSRFRSLQDSAESSRMEQATAQTLVASFNLEAADGPPILVLKNFDDMTESRFELVGDNIVIRLMNHREAEMTPNDPCNVTIGRDFAMFYHLVEDPPCWLSRSIPHLNQDIGRPLIEVDPVECERFKTPNSRPICPLAIIP